MGVPYAEVIGDPIAHSKSPLIHRFWLEKLGIEAEYRATRVAAADLRSFFEERRKDSNWRGCNVTIPHKIDVLRLADEATDPVRASGATNCILIHEGRLVADTTDIAGVRAVIGRSTGRICTIIGAGGAARAALAFLDGEDAEIRLIVRNAEKARNLLAETGIRARVDGFHKADVMLAGTECVINASPLGMAGQPALPREVVNGLAGTSRDALIFDMVYAPVETELLRSGAALSRRTVDGLVMLVAQAAAAFELFFGVAPPRQHDAELRALLTA